MSGGKDPTYVYAYDIREDAMRGEVKWYEVEWTARYRPEESDPVV